MSRPTQSLLVLVNDETNLDAIAVALRAVPGVKEVRTGCEIRDARYEMNIFVAQPAEPATP